MSLAPICLAEPETQAQQMQEVPEVAAQSVLLKSMDTGAVIYEKNADEQIHPASTTKIMTLIVALENCTDLEANVMAKETFDDDLVAGSSGINIKEGEILSVSDLLYAVAVASANDAANVLAEHIAGSVQGFVDMMNTKAAAIGAENTHFVNTHGLTAENHYTTARDMSLMMEYGMKVDMFQI